MRAASGGEAISSSEWEIASDAARPRNDVFVLSEVILPQPRGELMEKLARSDEGRLTPCPSPENEKIFSGEGVGGEAVVLTLAREPTILGASTQADRLSHTARQNTLAAICWLTRRVTVLEIL